MLSELDPRVAPNVEPTPQRILIQVNRAKASQRGDTSYPKQTFDVLLIESFGKPALIIDERGNARLIRTMGGQGDGYRSKRVYVSGKTFHVATPFEQPYSVLLSVYEKALASLTPKQLAEFQSE